MQDVIEEAPSLAMAGCAIRLAGTGLVAAHRIPADNRVQMTRIKTCFIQFLLVVIDRSS
jgi:hypothetical protein